MLDLNRTDIIEIAARYNLPPPDYVKGLDSDPGYIPTSPDKNYDFYWWDLKFVAHYSSRFKKFNLYKLHITKIGTVFYKVRNRGYKVESSIQLAYQNHLADSVILNENIEKV